MREMKDSGVEWIGVIPWHWACVKNKYLLDELYSGGTPTASNDGFYCYDNGTPFVSISDMSSTDYVVSTQRQVTEAGIADKQLKKLPIGTILYSIYATVGAISELRVEAAISQAMLALKLTPHINKSFYKYSLRAMKDYIFSQANGNTQFNLNAEKVKNFYFTLPDADEQRRIADYLDAKCAKIDALIAKQQEIIEKLKAYKLSVITEAVTKGLNPNVPMKDSGVEWIGEIPFHWFIHKFCWDYSAMLGKMLDAKRISGENLHPYIKNVNIQWFHIDYDNLDQMDFEENEMERYSVQAGDMMRCEGGEIGKCAIVPDNFPQGIFYQKALHRVRRRTENSGNIEFLSYLMFCMAKNECFDTSPEKATIAHLPGEALSQLRLPAPPIDEQQDIVGYLNQKCQQIEKSISTKQKIIDKLAEYKKSLIYEVVTGKREVN